MAGSLCLPEVQLGGRELKSNSPQARLFSYSARSSDPKSSGFLFQTIRTLVELLKQTRLGPLAVLVQQAGNET